MLGPSLAGILAQRVGLQQSFFLGVGCFVTATLAVVLLMRDLRPDSARPAFKWAAVNPLRSVPPPLQKSLSLILPIMVRLIRHGDSFVGAGWAAVVHLA
jgi:hypothetical protein